jgi:hypothetical protein
MFAALAAAIYYAVRPQGGATQHGAVVEYECGSKGVHTIYEFCVSKGSGTASGEDCRFKSVRGKPKNRQRKSSRSIRAHPA